MDGFLKFKEPKTKNYNPSWINQDEPGKETTAMIAGNLMHYDNDEQYEKDLLLKKKSQEDPGMPEEIDESDSSSQELNYGTVKLE
mmetsp:Transcript_5609/g.5116  ORF Transcript_5609/g.5116 Transcript_5609/m.5116 type:complete len:85 (+) Transcript_5609:742-996(+)